MTIFVKKKNKNNNPYENNCKCEIIPIFASSNSFFIIKKEKSLGVPDL